MGPSFVTVVVAAALAVAGSGIIGGAAGDYSTDTAAEDNYFYNPKTHTRNYWYQGMYPAPYTCKPDMIKCNPAYRNSGRFRLVGGQLNPHGYGCITHDDMRYVCGLDAAGTPSRTGNTFDSYHVLGTVEYYYDIRPDM